MRSGDSVIRDIVDGVALVLLLAAMMGFWSDCAESQDLPNVTGQCAPDIVEGRRRATLMHNGDTGVWIHGDVMRCMASRLEALPLYVERVRLLEQRLILGDERGALQERRAVLAEAEAEAATGALESSERGKDEAVEELGAWYRHPVLWVVVGFVITVALEALAIWALSEVANLAAAAP